MDFQLTSNYPLSEIIKSIFEAKEKKRQISDISYFGNAQKCSAISKSSFEFLVL